MKTIAITGNTYMLRREIKSQFSARWDREIKGWMVKPEHINEAIEFANKNNLGYEEIETEKETFAPLTTEQIREIRTERNLRKAERLEKQLEATERRAKEYYEKSNSEIKHIPFGQPILVGHHSESRHRNVIKRARGNMDKSVEESKNAEELRERIKNLRQPARVRGDAEREREEQIKKMDEKYKLGDRVFCIHMGEVGKIVKMYKKSYRLLFENGIESVWGKTHCK